ncbi:MAG: hypothetical protein LBC76_00430 [Treponema sp.]|nr:hypothetical protein [Treponema sp.]
MAEISKVVINSSIVSSESKPLNLSSSLFYERNYVIDDSSQPAVCIGNNVLSFNVFRMNLGNMSIFQLLSKNDIKFYEKMIPVSYSFKIKDNYFSRLKTIQWTLPDKDIDGTAFKKRFNELYEGWCKETQFDSFIGDPYHKCYDKIVRLGYKAVPYIITKLKEDPSLMFVALNRITGENPVKEENRGIVKKMAKDWIDWWEKKNNTN